MENRDGEGGVPEYGGMRGVQSTAYSPAWGPNVSQTSATAVAA